MLLPRMVLPLSMILSASPLFCGPSTFTFKPELIGHKLVVQISAAPFNRKAHKITKRMVGTAELTEVDGGQARGTDFEIPREEVTNVVVNLDGKSFSLPKKLFADCYNPNLAKDAVKAVIAEDRTCLLILLRGGDGAGAYSVAWVVRPDGNHTRILNILINLDPENNDI